MKKELPDGYTDQYDSNRWNVGHIFWRSDVYECWLDCEVRLTVEPNVSIRDAFEACMDHPMWEGYAVFFNRAFIQ